MDTLVSMQGVAKVYPRVYKPHERLRAFGSLLLGREPAQVIASAAELPLPLVDLGALAPARRRTEADRLAAAEVRVPFRLDRGPVARARPSSKATTRSARTWAASSPRTLRRARYRAPCCSA